MISFLTGLFIGYLIGVISATMQIINMETRENDKLRNILERRVK